MAGTMFVIEVIPLERGIKAETLSYFSSECYTRGTVLRIPVRSKTILGIAIGVQEVSAAKTALRAATFSLRRLPHQKKTGTLSPACIKTAEELAYMYASSVGAVLYTLLAPEIKSGNIPLPRTHHPETVEQHTPEVLCANKKTRHVAYRSLVREIFAHSGSVLFVVPTTAEADELMHVLSSGIEERTIQLTSTMTKRQLGEAYHALEDFSKSKVIIATTAHSMIERHDITLVVIEHARSSFFTEKTRPYLDRRDVLKVHAQHAGRRLLFADLLVRSEEEHFRRAETYQTFGEPPKRIELPGILERIEMRDKPEGAAPFKLFSTQVIEALLDVQKKKGRAFLFAPRRGLAPVVACLDCGHIFRSPQSGAPYSLVRTVRNGNEERWFVCGVSGHRERAPDVCPECGSWRLRERGIGIQYVYDELVKLILGSPITLFDHTTASTYKKACYLRDVFEKTKGGIMLGTQMALPYLTSPLDASAVVNMDALFATPTWRLQEENLALLLLLREKTNGTVYIQTRTKDDNLLKMAKHASIERFYDEEIELRKTFNYPPFTTFIHLTWQGKQSVSKHIESEIKTVLQDYNPTLYNAPPTPKQKTIHYGLIRIASKDWPAQKLVDALKSLPAQVRIVINPDRII